MNEQTPSRFETAQRDRRKTPFFQLGNEIIDVFQPIMGRECFTIYCHLERRAFKNPDLTHSVLELAAATGMAPATVSRSLEVLEHLVLIELTRCGGSQKSKCKLLDSEEAAERLGAKYQKSSLRWSLSKEAEQSLRTEIDGIRRRQQGKCAQSALDGCETLALAVSRRSARSFGVEATKVSLRHVPRTIGRLLREKPACHQREANMLLEKRKMALI